jgi:hypothetical protein
MLDRYDPAIVLKERTGQIPLGRATLWYIRSQVGQRAYRAVLRAAEQRCGGRPGHWPTMTDLTHAEFRLRQGTGSVNRPWPLLEVRLQKLIAELQKKQQPTTEPVRGVEPC